MSVGRKTGSKPLAFITALMVLFALAIPFIGTALANHQNNGGNTDVTVIQGGADDSAPAGTCNEFTFQAFGNPGNNTPAEGETIDIVAFQQDADQARDLVIAFCDPDGNGPATDLSGATDGAPANSGAQTPGGGVATSDCDDDNAIASGATFGTTGGAVQGCAAGAAQEFRAEVQEECRTDANGRCTFGLTSNEAGTMTVRSFFDQTGAGCVANQQNTTAQGCNESFDEVIKTWTAGAGNASTIACTPTTDQNPEGTRHEFRCTVTDAQGRPVPGATVQYDVTAGPNTEEIPQRQCGPTDASGQTAATGTETAPGSGQTPAGGETAGGPNVGNPCGYNDNLSGPTASPPGTDTITAFVNLPAQAGQPAPTTGLDAGEPRTTITKTWVGAARTIDCEPETATNEVGTAHTITCTVRDTAGNPVVGATVDFTQRSGPAVQFTPSTTNGSSSTGNTTNQQGQVTATISNNTQSATGTTVVRGAIAGGTVAGQPNTTECARAAGDPAGAPAGVCFDEVSKTWTRTPGGGTQPQCNDGVDNDGDGRIDAGQDPGCTDSTDNTESPDPAVEPTRVATNLTIRYDPPNFTGSVGSPRKACQRGRKVTLKKVVPGPNRTVGTDTSNRDGTWLIRKRRARGRFYAVVARKRFTNAKGVEIICLRDRSVTINTRN